MGHSLWRQLGIGLSILGLMLAVACGSDPDDDEVPGLDRLPDTNNGANNGPNNGASNNGGQPGEDDPTARQWVLAGSWYPDTRQGVREKVARLMDGTGFDGETRNARGILTPHAGINTSGPTAAEAFVRIQAPKRVLILAPRHHDRGEDVAIWSGGPWLMPGVALEVDTVMTEAVMEALPELIPDREAFEGDRSHPPEMQMPWLAAMAPETKITVLSFYDHAGIEYRNFDVERIERFGVALAQVVQELEASGEEILVLATTDLVHYVPQTVSNERDQYMMERFEAFDVDGLYSYVNENEVTICGEIPTSIFMVMMREMEHEKADFIARGDSFHRGQDDQSVVGYPAGIVWRK